MTDMKTPISSPRDDESPEVEAEITDLPHGIDIDEYRATVPLWKRVWQHSLTQMMLLSVQAFCGPAMSDAITGESETKFNIDMNVGRIQQMRIWS